MRGITETIAMRIKAMKHSRQAFTLVELLVVIAIIGVLVALLLPAVQAAREAVRKTQCLNNLRQIGVGLHNHHDTRGRFPSFFTNHSGNASRIADAGKGANWLVQLLPFLEQDALYNAWDLSIAPNQNTGRSTEIDIFQCPSDPQSSSNPCTYAGGGWARGNYGMNVSPCQFGVGTNRNVLRGGFGGVNFGIRIRDILDGTSNTVAVSEIRVGLNEEDLRGSWAMPGLASGTAALFGDAAEPNSQGPNSDDMENCAATGFAGNADRGMGCFDSNSTGQMAARSMHTGGLHVLLADSSTKFVSETIDAEAPNVGCGSNPGVWQAMHTRSGGEVVANQ